MLKSIAMLISCIELSHGECNELVRRQILHMDSTEKHWLKHWMRKSQQKYSFRQNLNFRKSFSFLKCKGSSLYKFAPS